LESGRLEWGVDRRIIFKLSIVALWVVTPCSIAGGYTARRPQSAIVTAVRTSNLRYDKIGLRKVGNEFVQDLVQWCQLYWIFRFFYHRVRVLVSYSVKRMKLSYIYFFFSLHAYAGYSTSRLSGQHCCFVFRKSQVRFSWLASLPPITLKWATSSSFNIHPNLSFTFDAIFADGKASLRNSERNIL
jgi:hypothetical protein